MGKYINCYEEDAIHYVQINTDSTFVHYYKKGNEQEKINKGSWRLTTKPSKTEVVFDTWTTFGYNDVDACQKCLWAVKFRDGELVFSYDMPKEMNFTKE